MADECSARAAWTADALQADAGWRPVPDRALIDYRREEFDLGQPESWRPAYRSVAPGSVRGIIGKAHDTACAAFERRQAAALGMTFA
jgi:hypothetical protein